MRRTFAILSVAAALALPAISSGQEEKSKAGMAGEGKDTITFTGCLSESSPEGEFLLKNVKQPAGQEAARPEPAGTTASSYRLIGGGKVNLKEHVGHQVEVTGKLVGAAGTEKAPAGAALSGEAKINVTALKHIATTCTEPIQR